jgi:hypothetical protein
VDSLWAPADRATVLASVDEGRRYKLVPLLLTWRCREVRVVLLVAVEKVGDGDGGVESECVKDWRRREAVLSFRDKGRCKGGK